MSANASKLHPSIESASEDNKLKILLAAYQKQAAELLALEASQEKLINLVLGIYSAGLTLMTALLKDSKSLLQGPNHTPSQFAWSLIAVAALIGIYALYMSHERNKARHDVREGLTRIEQALGFFEQGTYLQNEQVYSDAWLKYSKPGFLNWTHAIVVAAGAAFIVAVYFLAIS